MFPQATHPLAQFITLARIGTRCSFNPYCKILHTLSDIDDRVRFCQHYIQPNPPFCTKVRVAKLKITAADDNRVFGIISPKKPKKQFLF
jgi:hypothetical protein